MTRGPDSPSIRPPTLSRVQLAWLLGAAALAGLLHLLSPPSSSQSLAPYLARSRALLGIEAPGARDAAAPGWTLPVSLPVAASQLLQDILHRDSRARGLRVDERLTAQSPAALRTIFVCLAALTSLLAAWIASGLAVRRGRALAFGATLLATVLSPATTQSIAAGSGVLVAAPLLLVLASWVVRPALAAPLVGAAVVLGAIAAWAPFAWPFAFAFLVQDALAHRRAGRCVAMLALGAAFALALEPARLARPASLVAQAVLTSQQEGLWPVVAGEKTPFFWIRALPPLALVAALIGAALVARRGAGPESRRFAALVGVWVAIAVVVPGLSGVTRFGAVQLSAAPAAAIALGSVAGTLVRGGERASASRVPGRLGLAAAAVLLLAAVDLGRVAFSASALRGPVATPRAEWLHRIAAGELCLVERSNASVPDGDPRLFVLPRDPRQAERYDFAHWPHWYSGFRWVLLDRGEVKTQLERAGADLPRNLFQAVTRDGRLAGEWNEGGRELRLYDLGAAADWKRAPTDEALASFPAHPDLSAFLTQLGSAYANVRRADLALPLFRFGTERDPNSIALANNLAASLLSSGDATGAARTLESALATHPAEVELLFNAGRAYFALGAYGRAEQYYRRGLAVRADYAPLHYEIARCFVAQGKEALARSALERYRRLDPDAAASRSVDEILAALARVHSAPAGAAPGDGAAADTANVRHD